MPNIVIIGAGVSGLTSALLLSKNPANRVSIVAKHMPGDYDVEYTSPWAGANYLPVSDEANNKYEKNTWPELSRLATDVPAAGIHFQEARIFNRKKDAESEGGKWFANLLKPDTWFAPMMPNFKILPPSTLAADIDSATSFTSVCINTAIYLPWLVSKCLAQGCILKRADLSHVSQAGKLHASGQPADLIINCTGLLASKLGGVMDKTVFPARGQIVLVRNETPYMLCISGTDAGDDEVSYTMTRAAGGGTVLGGCYQKNNWSGEVDVELAQRIMERAVALCPELTEGKGVEALEVVRHAVGLRPLREDGVRIEKERLSDGQWVVHNYGHGGWGYQGSYGCSEKVVELADEILGAQKSKL